MVVHVLNPVIFHYYNQHCHCWSIHRHFIYMKNERTWKTNDQCWFKSLTSQKMISWCSCAGWTQQSLQPAAPRDSINHRLINTLIIKKILFLLCIIEASIYLPYNSRGVDINCFCLPVSHFQSSHLISSFSFLMCTIF